VRRLQRLAILCSAVALAACGERPWHGIVLEPPAAAPPLVVAGSSAVPATRFSLAETRGTAVLLYFGYTHW